MKDTEDFHLKTQIQQSFNPYAPLTEEELYSKLEKSREDAAHGQLRDASTAAADLRKKYKL